VGLGNLCVYAVLAIYGVYCFGTYLCWI